MMIAASIESDVEILVIEWQSLTAQNAHGRARRVADRILTLVWPVLRDVASQFRPNALGALSTSDLEQVGAIEVLKLIARFDATKRKTQTFKGDVRQWAMRKCTEYVSAHAYSVNVSDWARRGRKTVNGVTVVRPGEVAKVQVESSDDETARFEPTPDRRTPEALLDDEQTRHRLYLAIAQLELEQRALVNEHFGLGRDSESSLRSIAARDGVQRSKLAAELESALATVRELMAD